MRKKSEPMLIHSYKISSVNGPGNRFVLWTQGCSKGCKNCFNPETWNKQTDIRLSPREIFEIIKNFEIDGITLTGGDPLEQDDILELLMLLKELDLRKGIILFTGFTIDEIKTDYLLLKCLDYIDVLIDGRYEDNLRISSGLRGSENQNIIYFSDKIKPEELRFDHMVEIGYFNGELSATGFPYIDKKYLKEFGIKMR